MKNKYLLIGIIIIAAVFIAIISSSSFSPLKKEEFKLLLNNYKEKNTKFCNVDFLGINTKSEWYEVYLYNDVSGEVDENLPAYKEMWENKYFDNETRISKWVNCPVDSRTYELYESSFNFENFEDYECIRGIKSELNNPNNYFSYIYFSELEHYFLLYCVKKEKLYYLRRKGF